MKDILYEPLTEWLNGKIIKDLENDRDNHNTTHVMGCPVNQLIAEMEKGTNYGSAVTKVRGDNFFLKMAYSKYPLQYKWPNV